ncbi:MAG: hypothetical protein HY000_38115 [Planctomycetes bacterium]|nr:hypothetical protein [Planctomycetota bacterium]
MHPLHGVAAAMHGFDEQFVSQHCQGRLSPRIRYHLRTLFPKTAGWGARKDIERRLAMLEAVQDRLAGVLHPLEEVLYVAKGVQVEVPLLSWLMFLFNHVVMLLQHVFARQTNRILFVLTNLRVLMMNTSRRGRLRHGFWQLYYNQILSFEEVVSFKPPGHIRLKLRDGTRLRFSGLRRGERQRVKGLIMQAAAVQQHMQFAPKVSQSRESLCSTCFQVVPRTVYTCAGCGTEYVAPKVAAIRSLLLPCLGNFMLGQRFLGMVELVIYAVTWIGFVARMAANPAQLPVALPFLCILLTMEHGLSGALTYSMAKKALVPRRTQQPCAPGCLTDFTRGL